MKDFIELSHKGKRVLIRIKAIDFIHDVSFDENPNEKVRIIVNGTPMAVDESYELICAIIQEEKGV